MPNYKEKIVGDVTVIMSSTEDQGLCAEDGGKWVLICETHAYIIQHTNKNKLWGFAATPEIWCGGCQGNDARFEKAGA
jgi:hypothetical protein